MERNVNRDNRGETLAAVLQLAATVAVYLIVEADSTTVQGLQMRGWHTVRRGAWWASARCASLGLAAERRYNVVKG
jgi:hypothetical protein